MIPGGIAQYSSAPTSKQLMRLAQANVWGSLAAGHSLQKAVFFTTSHARICISATSHMRIRISATSHVCYV